MNTRDRLFQEIDSLRDVGLMFEIVIDMSHKILLYYAIHVLQSPLASNSLLFYFIILYD